MRSQREMERAYFSQERGANLQLTLFDKHWNSDETILYTRIVIDNITLTTTSRIHHALYRSSSAYYYYLTCLPLQRDSIQPFLLSTRFFLFPQATDKLITSLKSLMISSKLFALFY